MGAADVRHQRIFGGYPGPGPRRYCPARPGAKLSFRLVPDQDPKTVDAQFRDTSPGLPAGRDFRNHHAITGRRPCWSMSTRPASGPRSRHRGRLRHQAGLHARRGLDPGRGLIKRTWGSIPCSWAGARTTTTSTAPTRSSAWPTSIAASRPAPICWTSSPQEAVSRPSRRRGSDRQIPRGRSPIPVRPS